VTYFSFGEMHAAVAALRSAGDRATAVGIVERHLPTFPRHRALVHLMHAELLAEEGRAPEALATLDEALRTGCRYPSAWLKENPRLSSLIGLASFADLESRSQRQWDDATAVAVPRRTLLVPSGGSRHPLLVVLHGNNSDIEETLPFWSSVVDQGWNAAILQSGEAGATPGTFTWNDRERTAREIEAHVDGIRHEIDVDRGIVALAGFSMGALQAIALTVTGRLRAHGVISIAAWLPHIREFAALALAGTAVWVPSYVVVGTNDPSYDGTKQLVALVTEHGGRAHLDARDGLGHEYPTDMERTLASGLDFIAAIT